LLVEWSGILERSNNVSKDMRKIAEDFNRGYVQGWNQCLDRMLSVMEQKCPPTATIGRAIINPIIAYLKKARRTI
jgi:hypothetical protein